MPFSLNTAFVSAKDQPEMGNIRHAVYALNFTQAPQ
jgi:hypothetical protein